jgi:hypothetical protein
MDFLPGLPFGVELVILVAAVVGITAVAMRVADSGQY